MKIVIDEDLKREFKKRCVDVDSNMSEVVCALVEGWLQGRYDVPKKPKEQSSQKPGSKG